MNMTLSGVMSEEQLELYQAVMRDARRRGIHFAAGGSLALAFYAGLSRTSKDLDLYTPEDEKDAMIQVLVDSGMTDYYEKVPYDRGWIFRAVLGGIIVDVIWKMANRRADVDLNWIERGPIVDFAGESLRIIPVEEMIWTKLYVLQRDRCDWPDLLNVLDAVGEKIDWPYLKECLGEDSALLAAVLHVHCWLKPEAARKLPEEAWLTLPATPAVATPVITASRARLLDSRPWLSSLQEDYRC